MALYLGNQKVSLRSGQDPTFDYGFDSNGRLVFANKNATEINNFLNYDSSYSEILDLSNLSKMEKVAVNGTVDRKMEGLKGLLVSPNAPFTGSSPQINVSYTGLNKSALVSLFESAPYNVGYEKVGNPTIVDGVASGFSSSNCLQLNSYLQPGTNPWKVQIKATPNNVGNSQIICDSYYFRINQAGGVNSLYLTLYSEGDAYNSVVGTITNNTPFSLLLDCIDGKNVNVFLNDVLETTINLPSGLRNGANYLKIGSDGNVYFTGSIDLNNTYIKVNGVPWFTGKPAMTKTCSIVGATGTADLTQEDKNIILNKGWSLTVQ